MLISAFDYRWYVGAIAVTGIVLAAIYMLWAYQRMFTGPNPATSRSTSTPVVTRWPTWAVARSASLAPLMLALVAVRLLPGAAARREQPVHRRQLLEHTGVHDDGPQVPVDAPRRADH